MLQNVRFTAFTVSELLRLNQQEWWGLQPPSPQAVHTDFIKISRTFPGQNEKIPGQNNKTKSSLNVLFQHVKSIATTVTHISYTNNSDNCYIT